MNTGHLKQSASPESGSVHHPGEELDLTLLSELAELVASQLGVSSAFVARGTAEPTAFLVVVTEGSGDATGDSTALVEPMPLRFDPATLLVAASPIVVENVAADDREETRGLAAAFPGHLSFVVVPIGGDDGTISGIFGAGHEQPRSFSHRDLDLIVRAARLIRFERAGAASGGGSPDELIGEPASTGERMAAALARVLATGEAETLSVQLDHVAAGGPLDVRFEPLASGTGVTVMPDRVGDDISDAAIRLERQLLQTLIDLLPEQIFVKDTASRFTHVNEALLADFGLTDPEQIVGRTDFEFFAGPEAREFFAQEQELLASGVPIKDRLENQALPGRADHWRRTSKIPIRDRTGKVIGLVGSSWDVTAARDHERALSRLAALVEWSNDAIIGIDKDGTISNWNPAAERLLGYTGAEIVGQDYRILVPPGEPMILLDDLVNRAHDNEYVDSLETRRRRKDGADVEVEIKASLILDDAGEPAGVSVIMREIGERKAAEARLRELELRYRTFVERMPALTYINSPSGEAEVMPLIHLNQRFEEWCGYSNLEWERDPQFTFRIMHPDDRDRVKQHDDETNVTGDPYRAEYRLVAKDGRVIWVRDEAVLVRDEQGQPVYWLGFILDITDLKRAEAEAVDALAGERAANSELARANAMKSEIVSMISHEFRTPLTSIQGFSELLADEALTREEIESFAKTINVNARRLARMIRDVLDLERLEAGRIDVKWESVDLNEITDDVLASLRSTTSQHSFVTRYAPDLPLIPGDTDLLTQVITNLIANAIKYSPDGGDIVLTTSEHPNSVELIVRDQGLGIPAEGLESIFSWYSRIDRPAQRNIEGTGLGLPIVRQIVKLHEGSIWAKSDGIRGSEFHVRLPRRDLSLSAAKLTPGSGVS